MQKAVSATIGALLSFHLYSGCQMVKSVPDVFDNLLFSKRSQIKYFFLISNARNQTKPKCTVFTDRPFSISSGKGITAA